LLQKDTATELIERKPRRKSKKQRKEEEQTGNFTPEGGIEETRISYKDDVKFAGWRVMWNEEAGSYWEAFKKPFMLGTVPLLCGRYSNNASPKGNIGKEQGETYEYICDDPFLALNFLTVPENMKKLGHECIDNGFIPRFVTAMGEYSIPLPPTSGDEIDLDKKLDMLETNIETATPEDIKDIVTRKALNNASMILALLFNPAKYENGKLQVEFHKDAFRDIIDWEINMRKATSKNIHLINMRSRHMEMLINLLSSLQSATFPIILPIKVLLLQKK
jgi:hypothetical protein